MAALWKLSFVLFTVATFIALSSSEEAVSNSEEAVSNSEEAVSNSEEALSDSEDVFIMSKKAKPDWIHCDYTESGPSSCYDCNTLLICSKSKKKGGYLLPCAPGSDYCIDGECVATPSEECAPSTKTLTPETPEETELKATANTEEAVSNSVGAVSDSLEAVSNSKEAVSNSEEAVSDSVGAVSDSVGAVSDNEDDLIISEVAAKAKPGWLPCEFTVTRTPTCYDCNTRLICKSKKKGGFLVPCAPGTDYCVDGECVATPSEECAPSTTTVIPEATELLETTETATTVLDLDEN